MERAEDPRAPSPPSRLGLEAQERRIEMLLGIGHAMGFALSPEEMVDLLPEGPLASPEEVRAWIEAHRTRSSTAPVPAAGFGSPAETMRRQRAERESSRVREELPRLLRGTLPWVRCVVVTGSLAYGDLDAEGDVDFFVVCRDGLVWPFLLGTFLLLRLRPRADRPTWCFNHVLDARDVDGFLGQGSLLEARELLSARPLVGTEYFRGLVDRAVWVAELLPRLSRRPSVSWESVAPPAPRGGLGLRVLGWGIYPVLAAYLQLVGMRASSRSRQEGRPDEGFRTMTHPGRFSLQSRKYERLRELYGPAPDPPRPRAEAKP